LKKRRLRSSDKNDGAIFRIDEITGQIRAGHLPRGYWGDGGAHNGCELAKRGNSSCSDKEFLSEEFAAVQKELFHASRQPH